MRRLLAALLLLAAATAPAATVQTPSGPQEVFARGDLFDLVALLRLTGAEVAFAPAAGSYTASGSGHDVQFTPGGALAVADGKLVSLPGPVRAVEGHILGAPAVANALLAPFGWTLRGSLTAGFELVQAGGGDRVLVAVTTEDNATVVVIRGFSERPQVRTEAGAVSLFFPTPVELAEPVAPSVEIAGVEVAGRRLVVRLAPGVEVTSAYALDDPPRVVARLAQRTAAAPLEARHEGFLVVLDPGHGGDDQGARGPGGELEKDVTLAVARMAMAHLQTARVAARLTREGDETVGLHDRTALANRLRADVFVSIHANAAPARGARGAETYFMSADASDPQAAQAALAENAGVTDEALGLILWDLAHVANLNASSRLALALQERLNALHGIKDRGVRQAPFVVLTGATMPAALAEVGFLSNPEDARSLSGREMQERLAAALAAGIVDYLTAPAPEPTPAATP